MWRKFKLQNLTCRSNSLPVNTTTTPTTTISTTSTSTTTTTTTTTTTAATSTTNTSTSTATAAASASDYFCSLQKEISSRYNLIQGEADVEQKPQNGLKLPLEKSTSKRALYHNSHSTSLHPGV